MGLFFLTKFMYTVIINNRTMCIIAIGVSIKRGAKLVERIVSPLSMVFKNNEMKSEQ